MGANFTLVTALTFSTRRAVGTTSANPVGFEVGAECGNSTEDQGMDDAVAEGKWRGE